MTLLERTRRLACVAAVAMAGLALASPARADMTLKITDVNTGSTITIHDLGTGDAVFSSLPGTFGNYRINSIDASANYDGNLLLNPNTGDANVLNTVLRITQTGAVGGATDTLKIEVNTDTTAGWTIPSGNPLTLSSTLAVSRLDGSNGTATGSFATFSSTLNSFPASTTVTAPNAYSAVTTVGTGDAPNPGPPFSLDNTLTITTTGVGQVVNLSASSDATFVPEPSTCFLALSGGLSLFAMERRRRRKPV